jgi:hypothetical protein
LHSVTNLDVQGVYPSADLRGAPIRGIVVGPDQGWQFCAAGLCPRAAKLHGCSSPPVGVHRRVRDPLEDWIRKDAALAGTFTVQHAVVDRTCAGVDFIKIVQAPLAAYVRRR